MGKPERDAATVIADAEAMLRTARLGLKDFKGADMERRLPGLSNAVVFGRAVTNVIENLRSRVDSFAEWYRPRSAALGKDATFKRLYQMRSEILKQGSSGVSTKVIVESFDSRDLAPLMASPPPGATRFFMFDQTGGSGWEVELPTGYTVRYYVALPDSVKASSSLTLRLGDEDIDAAPVLERYLEAMERIVSDAKSKFL
ncbi:hypothetical protein AB0N65_11895 [Paenarthrobacter sp. NPDC089322]|uniref:hypothetical protein n=1 Tax=Paenarthrobacter sp. NPDC089322 TaxID=3155065 RepID=UPI00341D80B8